MDGSNPYQGLYIRCECKGGVKMSGVVESVTAGLTTTANSIMGAIGDIIPVALPVLGAVLVVTVGIKMFRRIAGR